MSTLDAPTTPAGLAANALRRLAALPPRRAGWVPDHPPAPAGSPATPLPSPGGGELAVGAGEERGDSLEAWTASLRSEHRAGPDPGDAGSDGSGSDGSRPDGSRSEDSATRQRGAGAHRPATRSGRVLSSGARVTGSLIPDTLRGGRARVSMRAVLALGLLVLLAVGAAFLPSLRSDGAAGVQAPHRTGGLAVASGAPATAAEASSPSAASAAAPATSPSPAAVLVHVVGHVANPGVITLPAGSRVADALAAAGGATAGADIAAVNLARILIDGEQVRIPAPGEPVVPPPPAGGVTGGGAAGAGGASADSAVLDLNVATESDLDGLPGVGPVLAARIVAWRTENGGFRSVDELQDVSGIGERTFAEIAPRVRV